MVKDYEIRGFNLQESGLEPSIISMQEAAYNRNFLQGAISSNTDNFTVDEDTLHLGAFVEGNIVGYNAFTPHTFQYQGKKLLGYQSGWTVTHPNHRKKGIFFRLINEAKSILKQRQGSFIFGYPNSNSEPIFTKKLDFSSVKLVKIEVPAVSLLRHFYIKNDNINFLECISLLEEKQFEFKKSDRNKDGIDIIKAEIGKSIIWGKKVQKQKWGVKFNVFSVGGIYVKDGNSLKKLLQKVANLTSAHFVQFVLHPNSPLILLFKQLKKAGSTEPFILFDLQDQNLDASMSFNFSSGVKDVY